jgi:hypothetical protein
VSEPRVAWMLPTGLKSCGNFISRHLRPCMERAAAI